LRIEKNRQFDHQSTTLRNRGSFLHNGTRFYGKSIASSLQQKKGKARTSAGKQWPSKFHTRRGNESFRRNALHQAESGEEEVAGNSLIKDKKGSGNVVYSADTVNKHDLLATFLEENEGAIPSWETKIVRDFFSKHLEHGVILQGPEPWAWMDDREHASGRSRVLPRSLTPARLCEELKRKVCQTI
jgi:hypothetical protein